MNLSEKYKLFKAIILADDVKFQTPGIFNETYRAITKDYVIESEILLPHFDGEKSQYTINAINRHKHLSYTLNGRIAQLATFIMNKKHAKTK